MEKKDFFQFLDKAFEGASLETIDRTLDAIEDEWLREYSDRKFSGYGYCSECKRYSKLSEFKVEDRVEENVDIIHGDEVLFEDKVRCYICPICKKVTDKMLIDTHSKKIL